ncbi:NADH-ubiquinone oxidoreductase assembly factor N7BML [Yarrowia sp. B02]|nr:NADH-ubiquinone oxidoreductase assembly factor N7BML [Yarrowia sp. B02]
MIPTPVLRFNPIADKVPKWKQIYHKWRGIQNMPFKSKYFVGYDLDGNSYWEFKNVNNPGRYRRIVEPAKPDLSLVDHKIPPQWVQWLRFTRPHHPTLEELIADKQRQELLQAKIAAYEAKWAEIPLKTPENADESRDMSLEDQLKPNFNEAELAELAEVFEKVPQKKPAPRAPPKTPNMGNLEVEEIIKHYPENGPDTVLADGGRERDHDLKMDYVEKEREGDHKPREWAPKVGVRSRG